MTNLNPFELRFKILEMAKDYLDNSYALQYEMAQKNLEMMKDQQQLTVDMWKKLMPEKYTMDEVLSKAQELYSFVDSKPNKTTK